MGTRQRLGFLGIAAIIAVAAVVVLGGDGGDGEPTPAATTSPTAVATSSPGSTPAATSTPRPKPPLLTPGGDTVLEARQGQTVRFRVRVRAADQVHVHGYDILRDVPAGRTVTVGFEADIPGVFEIELETAHQPLARLKVEP